MKPRQLMKVVASSITGVDGGRLETTIGKGIKLLKRGQQLMDFAQDFLLERGITHYTLHKRGDDTWATSPMMFLNQEPRQVLSFTFTQFDFDSLGYFAKDLTAAELERDLKPLHKLIYKE